MIALPMPPRLERRPMRLPTAREHIALVARGWWPSTRGLGWYVDGSASGDVYWWTRARDLRRGDDARWAQPPVDAHAPTEPRAVAQWGALDTATRAM